LSTQLKKYWNQIYWWRQKTSHFSHSIRII